MKCNYLFMWVKDDGIHRYKRKMWGVDRSQNSYTSGKWRGDKITILDNQDKFWLPWNPISSEIKHDQRLFLSMIQDEPYVYMVSKINNTSPKGVVEFTVVQDSFNKDADYVDNNPNSPTYGEMYADYYSSTITPVPEEIPTDIVTTTDILSIEAKTYNVRINGGSKVVNAKILDKDGNDVTNNYSSDDLIWSFELKDSNEDITSILSEDLTYNETNKEKYKYKFKFSGDEKYLNKIITVKLTINELSATADLDIVS